MKRIDKAAEPEEFSDWKDSDKMAHRPRWKRVSSEVKNIVHRALMKEQGFLCCYCETAVSVEDSHVEHFRPRKKYPDKQLDYQNLHCSCQRAPQKGEPRHCGNKKGSWYCEELMVSPLDPQCGKRFSCLGNGEVCPRCADDDGAKEMIARLGLNLPKLKSLRSAAIDALCDLPSDEVRDLLQRDEDGHYISYFSAIAQVLASDGLGDGCRSE